MGRGKEEGMGVRREVGRRDEEEAEKERIPRQGKRSKLNKGRKKDKKN